MYEVQHKDTILPPLPVAKRGYALNPNRSLDRLPIIFRLFPSLPVHLSFACRHLACLILST